MIKTQEQYRELLEQRLQQVDENLFNIAGKALAGLAVATPLMAGTPAMAGGGNVPAPRGQMTQQQVDAARRSNPATYIDANTWRNMGFLPGTPAPGSKPVRSMPWHSPQTGSTPLGIHASQLPPGVPGTSNYGPPSPGQTDPITRQPVKNTPEWLAQMGAKR